MAFDVISIVYISIFVLSVLVGLKRGFLKTLVSFIKGLGSFVVAVFLCKPLATLLTNSSVGAKMAVKMSDYFLAKGGVFTATVTNEIKEFNSYLLNPNQDKIQIDILFCIATEKARTNIKNNLDEYLKSVNWQDKVEFDIHIIQPLEDKISNDIKNDKKLVEVFLSISLDKIVRGFLSESHGKMSAEDAVKLNKYNLADVYEFSSKEQRTQSEQELLDLFNLYYTGQSDNKREEV